MKEIAVFNDLSGYGKCSLAVALPILSVLGCTCHAIPTAVLTGQGGYANFHCEDMTAMLPQYEKNWQSNNASLDGIYTGYMTCPEQMDIVASFIDTFLKQDSFLLVDPVMGDHGRVYRIFSEPLLEKMKALTKRAHMITPNLTEACLLADVDYETFSNINDNEELLSQVSRLALQLQQSSDHMQDVLITGVRLKQVTSQYIYIVAAIDGKIEIYKSYLFDKSFSGTGDLFASTMCGLKMKGYSTKESMKIAGDFLYHSIADTMNENTPGNDGILFEAHLPELIRI